jgi:NAD(P)H-nitrite reductase large subunit
MQNYKYLIIGGGMTAAAATEGIRSVDSNGSIGIISSENDPPYNRPPLSKALWKGDALDSIWRKMEGLSAKPHLGRIVTKIDTKKKTAIDSQGEEYAWDKLLLATGCSPRLLSFGQDEIIYYRTVNDYRRLRSLTDGKTRFAVIGGGFIGSEIAAAFGSSPLHRLSWR